MSHTLSGELTAAVHQRLLNCSHSEGLAVLAYFAGILISNAPERQRPLARGLFIKLVDRSATTALGGNQEERRP
jgi:hypothetical protein